ncbi:hypothetical protein Cni_G04769 [Canna indica]|uniref:Uncharacterized protein n=1 Tax=Canna indica TaxID=4628 RepID=A0AAQ3JVZ2_9LILI|nr:hypothetical protein Cni_G04769 [Canna indica]
MTTTRTITAMSAAKGCVGEDCDVPRPWPLHHIRHRGSLRRLCTSCVLKSNPGSFCTTCLAVLGPGPLTTVAHCSKCPSVCHLTCLPSPDIASRFLCPCCSNPDGFSYYPSTAGAPTEDSEGSCVEKRKTIGAKSAKALLAAARIAAGSVIRAAASSKLEAERKVKEAMVARKRAREMLERALLISKNERERVKQVNGFGIKGLTLPSEIDSPPKKKALQPKIPQIPTQKRVQSREREKWMRFNEPIPMAASMQGSAAVDAKNSTIPQSSK